MRYLSLAEILDLHGRIVEQSGGAEGVRDLGGILSALAQPEMTFGGRELYPTIESKAAALCYSLVNNHPFIDITYAKGQKIQGEEFVQWNSFSRIGVAKEPDSKRRIIIIDADASTGIANFDIDLMLADTASSFFHSAE